MSRDIAELWNNPSLSPPRVRAITGARRRRSPTTAPLAEIWDLRARDAANAQRIVILTKRNKELEMELGERQRATFSREVSQLLTGEFDSDETEDLMVAMHVKMAAGDMSLAYELACVAIGIPAPDEIDARCLALETIATARLAKLEPLLYLLIGFCLTSDIERLQFRAIGAANLLPRATRLELSGAIKEAVARAAQGSSVRRLGALFLENNK